MKEVAIKSLSAGNLSVDLERRRIINACSFEIHCGEFLTIAGPNGAGKSTLLRALVGLLPYQGCVKLDGQDLVALTASRRARTIAWLPQTAVAHWPMRVRDVVALGRMPLGASLQRQGSADAEAVQSAMDDCGLNEFAGRPVTELSGGELARVMLARVLATQAPVILADEPTASLDPAHQLLIMELLARAASRGCIVISASHEIGLALRYSHRMIALDAGVIAGDATPAQLVDTGVLQRIFGVRFARAEIDGAQMVAISA